MPSLTTSIQHCTEPSTLSQEKEIKPTQTENKYNCCLFLCKYDCLHRKSQRISKKLPRTSTWVHQGYRMLRSMYKNELYFYLLIMNGIQNFKSNTIWIALPKYLGLNLTKNIQDLCATNYKTLMKLNPNKNPGDFFVDISKLLKFIGRDKGTRIAKTIVRKMNKVGWLTLPNFKT